MPDNRSTADIGFEKQIWDAACVLRGNMDASEYKKGYPTILPDKETLQRFDDIVKPMFLQMQNLTRESHKLADTRDVLLPQLMSGEIDVSNVTS